MREYRRRLKDDAQLGTGKVVALQIAGRRQAESGCLRSGDDPGNWDRVDRDHLSAVCCQALRRGDFGEFLPLLRNNPTFLTQLEALLRYYVEDQGRLNVIPYFFIVTKWLFFGWHVPLWQTARFLQMWLIVTGVYVVLRELGVARFGALCGAALFVVAPPGMAAWVRLTAGRATRYSPASPGDTSGDRISAGRSLALAGYRHCLVASGNGIYQGDAAGRGAFRARAWRAAAAQTDVSSRSEPVTAIGTWSVFPARCSRWQQWPSCGSHSTRKQMPTQGNMVRSTVSSEAFLAPLILFLLPGYSIIGSALPRTLIIANEVFLAILAGGWWLAFRSAVDKSEMRRRLVIPLLLLLPGALAYVPWDGHTSRVWFAFPPSPPLSYSGTD